MKNLLFFLLMATLFSVISPQQSKAQVVIHVTPSKASLVDVDTANAILPIDSYSQSVEMVAVKTSGTTTGKIYLMGLVLDGTVYIKLDSMDVADVSGQQYKLITMGQKPFIYARYKFMYISASGTWAPGAYVLRRNN